MDDVSDHKAFKALDAIMQVLELMFMDTTPPGAQVVSPEQYGEQVKKAALQLVETAKQAASKGSDADEATKQPQIGGKPFGQYL